MKLTSSAFDMAGQSVKNMCCLAVQERGCDVIA